MTFLRWFGLTTIRQAEADTREAVADHLLAAADVVEWRKRFGQDQADPYYVFSTTARDWLARRADQVRAGIR